MQRRTAGLESLVAPIDVARAALLRAAAGPQLARFVRDRDARITAIAIVAVVAAFVGAAVAPIWLLALGPIALGVPHLVADVRYLVARKGLHRELRLLPAVAPLVGVCFTSGVLTGLLSVPLAVLAVRGAWRRKTIALLLWGAVYVAAIAAGQVGDLLFVHAHNVVAVAIWWRMRKQRPGLHALVLVVYALAALAIFGGLAESIMRASGGAHARLPLSLDAMVTAIAPALAPALAVRVVLFYAFAQSVHYAVWVRLIPEDDRDRPAPRSFASSLRALRGDLGGALVVASVTLAFALASWAVVDLLAARNGYLRAAQFHGHLELAAVAFLWVRGGASGEPR